MKKLIITLALFILAFAFAGCSSNGTLPTQSEVTSDSPGGAVVESYSQRVLWGIWDINLDIANLSAEVVPLRAVEAHFNVTPMVTPPACLDCVMVDFNSFDPVTRIMDLNVTLRNPTSISGHDVRGILFTNTAGHMLVNPDDWTGLWDIAEGDTINPFKAFAKTNPTRTFAGLQQHMENYLVYIPAPPQYAAIKYAVDASWPGNCKEPYSIENFAQDQISPTIGSHGIVQVDVHDWQGDTSEVKICASMITGDLFTALTHQGGDVWSVDLTNTLGAAPGTYGAEVLATSANSGTTALYDFVTITITETGDPGWARTWGDLNVVDLGTGVDIDGQGNIYIAGWYRGTADFDPGAGIEEHTSVGQGDPYLCKYNKSGEFQWVRTWGSTADDFATDVAVDDAGNAYVFSDFEGTLDFDPGPGVEEHTSNGGSDFALSKFDTDGNFQWARTWGKSASWETTQSVEVDELGNVFVYAWFYYTIDFDPGPGVTEVTSNGWSDFFLTKFNTSGDFQWVRTWGGNKDEQCRESAVDGLGNVYVTGYFWDTVDFDTGAGVDEHTATASKHDACLSKFNSDGEFQWARTWGGTDHVAGDAVAADASTVYVSGWFLGTTDFDPAAGTDNHSSNGGYDIFLSKFDPSGNFQWARTWGGDADDEGWNVAIADDNAIVTGHYRNTADMDPGPGIDERIANGGMDIFVSKFNSVGNYVWARTWGGEYGDQGLDVVVDSSGNFYITGGFMGTADFDPGPAVDEHTGGEWYQSFLVKFKPGGFW